MRIAIIQFPSEEHGKMMEIELILSLLNFAFVFGNYTEIYISLWDLRTYSQVDLSYDIC